MITRRSILCSPMIIFAPLSAGALYGCANGSRSTISLIDNIGPLSPPDGNGLMLPNGFTSRIIARSGIAPYIGSSSFLWHDSPDGGATFSTNEGGWIYVSNSELSDNLGGASAIQFDASGNIIDSYKILGNTTRNCAGGASPWGTWLSCEEFEGGIIWECDPYGKQSAIPRPALGTFTHEAVTLDTQNNILYMTEDRPDGCFYRYVPGSINNDGYPNLTSGTLEVAVVEPLTSTVTWALVLDPNALSQSTRYQVGSSTAFIGGEGIVYHNGIVSFATKGDNRIWSYDTVTKSISVVYDASTHPNPILTGVDNITLTKDGELVIGEDGGDLQIVVITKTNNLVPLIQLVGHDSSEVTGPSFSPDGRRLYFSSQRGTTGNSSDGATFEVSGPFHT